MSAGKAPSRGWRWAAFAAASFCAASAMAGSPAPQAPQDTFLDFNDNQVPAGWSLVVMAGGDHCGVAKKRFYAGEFENDCLLESPMTVQPGTNSLTIKWKGNLTPATQGSQVASLSTSSTKYGVNVQPKGNGNTRIAMVIGDNEVSYDHADLPAGTYSYTLQLTNTRMTFSATLNGAQMFKHRRALTGFSVDQAQLATLRNAVLMGADLWMDNVSIRQISN